MTSTVRDRIVLNTYLLCVIALQIFNMIKKHEQSGLLMRPMMINNMPIECKGNVFLGGNKINQALVQNFVVKK